MKFSAKVGNGPMNKWLILVAIRITDPDGDTGKTCLGGCMHCHSASSSTDIIDYDRVKFS